MSTEPTPWLATTAAERLRELPVGLKMARALEAFDDIRRRPEDGTLTALEAIYKLPAEEFQTREGRRIKAGLMTARLSRIKTLEDDDFASQPSLEHNRVLALAQLDFVQRKEVVPLLGPPGTGKTHLATAPDVQVVRAGKSVYFATLAEIITSRAKAEREGSLASRIRFLTRNSLVIVDEIGYRPFMKGSANLFFRLANARYEKGAKILTSNSASKEWGEIFGDNVIAAALLNLLIHHTVVINIQGNSYRLRAHRDLMPENLINPDNSEPPPKRRPGRPGKVQD